MSTYRVSFSRSNPCTEEVLVLCDGADGPAWDTMDVVEQVVASLAPDGKSPIRLPRPRTAAERSKAVLAALDPLDIVFLQYVIEDTGVRRTVRQSRLRCSFRK